MYVGVCRWGDERFEVLFCYAFAWTFGLVSYYVLAVHPAGLSTFFYLTSLASKRGYDDTRSDQISYDRIFLVPFSLL